MDNETRLQSSKSEKPLHELLDSPTVDIYVGEENTRWPLPEKLLCHHSPVFTEAFESDNENTNSESESRPPSRSKKNKNKSYSLSDEENETFKLLVAYFYAQTLPPATSEKAVGPLLDLYLLAQRLQIDSLTTEVVDAVRGWYHESSTYPGLRRVQYIYANTDEDNEMREMMVSAVARQLATGEVIPLHWAKALQRNGQLAVDIIRSIQQWHIEERSIPDVRDGSIGRDRKMKGGFSAVEREDDSTESAGTTETTETTETAENARNMADSAIGLESHDGDNEEHVKGDADGNVSGAREVAGEALRFTQHLLSPSSLSLLQAQLKRPPDPDPDPDSNQKQNPHPDSNQTQNKPPKSNPPPPRPKQMKRKPSTASVTFAPIAEIVPIPSPVYDDDDEDDNDNDDVSEGLRREVWTMVMFLFERREGLLLFVLWGAWVTGGYGII